MGVKKLKGYGRLALTFVEYQVLRILPGEVYARNWRHGRGNLCLISLCCVFGATFRKETYQNCNGLNEE